MIVEKIRLYDNRDDVTLSAYILDDSQEMLKGKNRPAILICPGGAYLSCSDREAEPIAIRMASFGYHTFVLRYSVYSEGKGFPDLESGLEPKECCEYPNPLRDIGKAMLYIKTHSEKWRINENLVGLCGFSAGAHNCAMYATHWHRSVLTDYFKREKEIFRPAVCILGYAVSDFVYMNEYKSQDLMVQELMEGMNRAYLGENSSDPEYWKKASPTQYVTEYTPPTFLWATAEDQLVPVQHTIKMAHALADYNIPFEMHIFESGPHGLATATQSSASSLSEENADVAVWMDLCEKWLLKRFKLNLPKLNDLERMLKEFY